MTRLHVLQFTIQVIKKDHTTIHRPQTSYHGNRQNPSNNVLKPLSEAPKFVVVVHKLEERPVHLETNILLKAAVAPGESAPNGGSDGYPRVQAIAAHSLGPQRDA